MLMMGIRLKNYYFVKCSVQRTVVCETCLMNRKLRSLQEECIKSCKTPSSRFLRIYDAMNIKRERKECENDVEFHDNKVFSPFDSFNIFWGWTYAWWWCYCTHPPASHLISLSFFFYVMKIFCEKMKKFYRSEIFIHFLIWWICTQLFFTVDGHRITIFIIFCPLIIWDNRMFINSF